MTGYSRIFNKINGDLIEAPDFVNEYDAIDAAFDKDTGHSHDGGAASGALVPVISDQLNLNELRINVSNQLQLYLNVGGFKTLQLVVVDGAILPAVDNDIDLGSSGNQIKDIFAAGTANLSSLALNSGVTVDAILDDSSFSANSSTAVPTQASTKSYVDTLINTPINTVSIPSTAIGQIGDKAGMVAADSSTLYICIADYDGFTVIWRSVAISTF